MAEGSYEYECMRAELLGVEKPDYDEFMRNKKEEEVQEVADEENDIENLKVRIIFHNHFQFYWFILFQEADHQSETVRNLSGGLEELNSILQVTQRKINKFKVTCGSLTNLLKIKIGQGTSSDASGSSEARNSVETAPEASAEAATEESTQNGMATERKSDLARALDNHVDKIDDMIEKAENAQYSMAYQSKQMREFLKWIPLSI